LIVLDEPFSGLDPLVRDEFVEGLGTHAPEATILISSHDLAEVERFATHVGYLDAGRLQLSENLSNLSERFRQIEITLDLAPVLPEPWPPNWLKPQTSAAVVRFVESRFDNDRTPLEIHRRFPSARNVSVTAMPLRDIFIALAASARRAA
jgi:ABC-2 type transport system ATP-binding protein